ncbi:hypothetical protein HMI54_012064 [Coelomomyces lativittatus]|nr:hypothetical protein HMI54_012064 [Coelomomyces lativittatus]
MKSAFHAAASTPSTPTPPMPPHLFHAHKKWESRTWQRKPQSRLFRVSAPSMTDENSRHEDEDDNENEKEKDNTNTADPALYPSESLPLNLKKERKEKEEEKSHRKLDTKMEEEEEEVDEDTDNDDESRYDISDEDDEDDEFEDEEEEEEDIEIEESEDEDEESDSYVFTESEDDIDLDEENMNIRTDHESESNLDTTMELSELETDTTHPLSDSDVVAHEDDRDDLGSYSTSFSYQPSFPLSHPKKSSPSLPTLHPYPLLNGQHHYIDPILIKGRSFRAFFSPHHDLVTWHGRTIKRYRLPSPSSSWGYPPFPLLEKLATTVQPLLQWDSDFQIPVIHQPIMPVKFQSYMDLVPATSSHRHLLHLLSVLFDPLLPEADMDKELRHLTIKSRLIHWLERHVKDTAEAYARLFSSQQRYVLAIFIHLCVNLFDEAKVIAGSRQCSFLLPLLSPLPSTSSSPSFHAIHNPKHFTTSTSEPLSSQLPFKSHLLTAKDKQDYAELMQLPSLVTQHSLSLQECTWLHSMPFCLVFLILNWAFPTSSLHDLMKYTTDIPHASKSSTTPTLTTISCPFDSEVQCILSYFVTQSSLPKEKSTSIIPAPTSLSSTPSSFSTSFLTLCHTLQPSSNHGTRVPQMDVFTLLLFLHLSPPTSLQTTSSRWFSQYAILLESVPNAWHWSLFVSLFVKNRSWQRSWWDYVLYHHVTASITLDSTESWLQSFCSLPAHFLYPYKARKCLTTVPTTAPWSVDPWYQTQLTCCLRAGPAFHEYAVKVLEPWLPTLLVAHEFQKVHDMLTSIPTSAWSGILEFVFTYVQAREMTPVPEDVLTQLLSQLKQWEKLALNLNEAHYKCLRLIQYQCHQELQFFTTRSIEQTLREYQTISAFF